MRSARALAPSGRQARAAFGCAGCGAALTPRRAPARCARRQRVRMCAPPAAPDGDEEQHTATSPAHAPPNNAPASMARPPARPRRQQPAPQLPSPVIRTIPLEFIGKDVKASMGSVQIYTRDLRPKLNYLGPQARERVQAAVEVANVAHKGQKRKSGEPYIIHPVAVAAILADMRMDQDSVIAGLLHDTVEDTKLTLHDIFLLFGQHVRRIVEGETKISKLAKKVHGQNSRPIMPPAVSTQQRDARSRSKMEEEQQKQADNLRGMFLAMTEDVRVLIVKLADRLHNMRTLEHMKPEKQQKISKETLEFFAPLAHRLGMRRIKAELEELSFQYLHPVQYRELKTEVESIKNRARFDHYLSLAKDKLTKVLEEDRNLCSMVRGVEVIPSTKTLYEIYKRRMYRETVTSMLDVANLTVVIDLAKDVSGNDSCYQVLGRIHNLWKPIPKRFKDYIAFMKPNGYQSLHTAVLLGQKYDFFAIEVQIRTRAMHNVAEEGIAAELAATGSDTANEVGATLGDNSEWRHSTKGWLTSIRDYIGCFSSSRDLVEAVRRDLLGNRVFVLTPKGSIIDLPNGSTPVDLAYRIHSDVGHKMIGVYVNGHMARLDHKLHTADIVRIVTSNSSSGPSSEWMGFAKSRKARQRIRSFLRARDRNNMLDRGRVVLENAATKLGYPFPSEAALTELIPRLSAVLNATSGAQDMTTVDDLYIAIAKSSSDDEMSIQNTVLSMLRDRRHAVIDNAAPKLADTPPKKEEELETPDQVNDGRPLLESATCCHPVRGDEVMGIRSVNMHGRTSVVVHRQRCEHLLRELHMRPVSSRVVGLRWKDRMPIAYEDNGISSSGGLTGRVVVVARDCDGLLTYVTGVLTGMGCSIRRAFTATDPVELEATLAFEVLVSDAVQLRNIVDRIRKCDEVTMVQRLGPNEGGEYFPAQLVRHFRTSPLAGGGGEPISSTELEIDDIHGDDDIL